jgi:hypothetical protein
MSSVTTPPYRCLVDDYYKAHFIEEEEECDQTMQAQQYIGRIDYRDNTIIAVDKDRRISIVLEFSLIADPSVTIPIGFEETWCPKFEAMEIATSIIPEHYNVLDASWDGNKLIIFVDNLEEYYSADVIIEELESIDLNDYEGDFWILQEEDIVSKT